MSWYWLAMRKYCDFTGRARRKEYWYFTLYYSLGLVLFVVLDVLFGTFNSQISLGWLTVLYLLASLLPMLGVSVRRLHDIGRSGWWVLLNFLPGFGSAVLSVIALFNSQPGSNAFGPNPKQALEESESVDFNSGKRQKKSIGARAVKAGALVVSAAAVVCGAAWFWWSQNSAEILANGKAHIETGRIAGRALDESGCVSKAASALAGEAGTSLLVAIENAVELSGCLDTSRATPGFCDGIPAKTEIFATGQWIASVCGQFGYGGNASCNAMIQHIPEYCTSDKRSKKMDLETIGKT
jgi:uncharacterized membrane protein YhaH (DUF805 family)